MTFPITNGGRSLRTGLGILLAVIVLLAGCAPQEEPTAAVSGKVTLDDEAVSAGTVLFMSEDGRAASAELRSDGSYTLNCPLGSFKVSVTPPPPADPLANPDAAESEPAVEIPEKYQDFASSGLVAQVGDGANTFDIPLTSE